MGLTRGVKSHRLSGKFHHIVKKNVIGSVRIACLCLQYHSKVSYHSLRRCDPHSRRCDSCLMRYLEDSKFQGLMFSGDIMGCC